MTIKIYRPYRTTRRTDAATNTSSMIDFKVTFYNAQVYFQTRSDQTGFCRYTVPVPLETKLLLVDRRWRKQRGFNPALVPSQAVAIIRCITCRKQHQYCSL